MSGSVVVSEPLGTCESPRASESSSTNLGVLAANNPTLSNLELSLHIDHIDAYPDGRVVLRTCQLGALYDVVDLLALDLVVIAPSIQKLLGGQLALVDKS